MSPEISIVMPVHNTERYLPEALDSLLAQTFGNFELICVDDASTDGSAALLQAYQARSDWQHPMQILTHPKARGAAISRNDGMALARGTYLICLDSDDRFSPTMLEKAWRACRENDADVAMYGINYWYPNGDKLPTDSRPAQKKYLRDFPLLLHPSNFALLPFVVDHPPWNKLVRRRLVEEKKITFQDIPNTNDFYFSLSASLQANKIVFLDEVLVDYRCERPNNLSGGRTRKKSYRLQAFDAYYTLLQRLHLSKEVQRGFLNYVARSLCGLSQEQPQVGRQYAEEMRTTYLSRWGLDAMPPKFFYTPNLYACCQALAAGKMPGPYFDTLLACSDEKLQTLFADLVAAGKRAALWGAGKYGRMTLERLEQLGLRLDAVVDTSPQKQGTDCCGYQIQPYEAVADKVDVILITNSKWRAGIEQQTQGRQEIVDLMEILENLQAFA